MKLYTLVSTWYIHFIFFTSICKITAESNNFTLCIYVYHCFRAHSGSIFI